MYAKIISYLVTIIVNYLGTIWYLPLFRAFNFLNILFFSIYSCGMPLRAFFMLLLVCFFY